MRSGSSQRDSARTGGKVSVTPVGPERPLREGEATGEQWSSIGSQNSSGVYLYVTCQSLAVHMTPLRSSLRWNGSQGILYWYLRICWSVGHTRGHGSFNARAMVLQVDLCHRRLQPHPFTIVISPGSF